MAIDNLLKGVRKYSVALGLGILASLYQPNPAYSQGFPGQRTNIMFPKSGFWVDGISCNDRKDLEKVINEQAKEKIVAYGVDTKERHIYSLFITGDLKNFTLMRHTANQKACIIATGYDIKFFEGEEFKMPSGYPKQIEKPPSKLNCNYRKDAIEELRDKHQETIMWRALITQPETKPLAMLEFFYNEIKDKWTLLYSTPDGAYSCTVANGKMWTITNSGGAY